MSADVLRLVVSPLVALSLVLCTASAGDAVTDCRIRLNKRDGSLLVSARNVTGTLRWGIAAGEETNAFFSTETCVGGGTATNCALAPSGDPSRITPPPLCTLYVKDEVLDEAPTNCSIYIKGCVPGLRVFSEAQLEAINRFLGALSLQDGGDTFRITRHNLQIASGSGATDGAVNGTGNLIVGYNENANAAPRTGSHNLVVGRDHGYSSHAGVVADTNNRVSGPAASVTGGNNNVASGTYSAVSGGSLNTATGYATSISGGESNGTGG